MSIEIRKLNLDEATKILHFISSYAFTPTPPLPEFEAYAEHVRSRAGATYFGVIEDGQPMAICRATTPLDQNLRGKIFPMGGVASVSTHPAARRKGYVRALMDQLFQHFQQNQMATSCLYPFKEVFYEKFGYVTLPQARKITFKPECLRPLLKMPLEGSYEMLQVDEGYPQYRDYLEKFQRQTHGMALFETSQERIFQKQDAWIVFARVDNEVVGVMNYTLSGQIMHQTLEAPVFYYSNAHGKFMLLNWIARHIDQATTIILKLKPELFGELFYTDITPDHSSSHIPPMARVTNISALSGLPIGEGEITVEITDPDCEWNNGVWHLSSQNGRLVLAEDGRADCALSIHGLTALVYGVHDPDEFTLRGWGNPNPEQQAILRQMFPPAVPHMHAEY